MPLFTWILAVTIFVAFSIYVTDSINKMRDDVRMIKLRTGKLIRLLDSSIVASNADARADIDGSVYPSVSPEHSITRAPASSGTPSLTKTLGSFITSAVSTSKQQPGKDGDEQGGGDDIDDDAINQILARIKTNMPATVTRSQVNFANT